MVKNGGKQNDEWKWVTKALGAIKLVYVMGHQYFLLDLKDWKFISGQMWLLGA